MQIIAATKKGKEQRAKRFMEAILAERHDSGKSAGWTSKGAERRTPNTEHRIRKGTIFYFLHSALGIRRSVFIFPTHRPACLSLIIF